MVPRGSTRDRTRVLRLITRLGIGGPARQALMRPVRPRDDSGGIPRAPRNL